MNRYLAKIQKAVVALSAPLRRPPPPSLGRDRAEPATRTYRLWTVDLVRLAESSADAGNLSRAADLCDALLGDDRIPALLQTRAQGLFGLVPTFEASGDGRRRNRAVRALEAGEDWCSLCPETEGAQILVWGLLLGLAPGELRWYDDEGKSLRRDGRHVPELRFRHPKHLRHDATLRRWFLTVENGQEVPFTPGDGHWFLFAPYGLHRPWQHGAWRGLARWWLLKQYAIADWGEHGERGASLFVESELEADSTRELRRQLAQDLSQMASQGVCVLPPGFSAKLAEITANTTAIYQAQVETADTAAAIRILGHNLTSKVDGGSFAAAETGDGIRLDLRKFDAESWSTATHTQALVHWAGVNFGAPSLAPWPAYPVEPKADKKKVAEELEVLSRALVQLDKAPDYVDKKLVLEERGVPLRKGATITPPPASPSPAAPSAPHSEGIDEPEKSDPEPEALGVRPVGLSGRQAVAEGMLWSDSVAANAAVQGQAALAAHVNAVLSAIAEAQGYDDLRARLLRLLDGDTPEFRELVYRALILAEGRGALSVTEEP